MWSGRHFSLIAGVTLAAALSVDRGMEVVLRDEPPHPEPAEPRRARAPAGGRTYNEKGKRQAARHLRQMERIAAKRAAPTPKGT